MASDLSQWLASELGGRVTKTELRTGFLLRRTSKIVANRDGLSWECYVNAASAWLWINNRGVPGAAFSVNRKSHSMLLIEPVADAFDHLSYPVFARPPYREGSPYPRENVQPACRRLEPFFAALDLGRWEFFTTTPDQITLWNRRPDRDRLRRRIQLLRENFGTP